MPIVNCRVSKWQTVFSMASQALSSKLVAKKHCGCILIHIEDLIRLSQDWFDIFQISPHPCFPICPITLPLCISYFKFSPNPPSLDPQKPTISMSRSRSPLLFSVQGSSASRPSWKPSHRRYHSYFFQLSHSCWKVKFLKMIIPWIFHESP